MFNLTQGVLKSEVAAGALLDSPGGKVDAKLTLLIFDHCGWVKEFC